MQLFSLSCSIILLLEIVIISQNSVHSTVTIPAPIAFGAIIVAVKLKLILVKIMYALKTAARFRFKRSLGDNEIDKQAHILSNPEIKQEILNAWLEFEETVQQKLNFYPNECISGVSKIEVFSNEFPSKSNRTNKRLYAGNVYDQALYLFTQRSKYRESEDEVSKFLSSIIGLVTGIPEACHFLQEII